MCQYKVHIPPEVYDVFQELINSHQDATDINAYTSFQAGMQFHFWRVLLQQQNGSQSNLALVVGLKSLYNSLHLYMNTKPSNWQSQVFTFVLGQPITEVHHLVFNAHVNCQGLQEGKNKTHPITNASLVYCSWHTITLFLKAWWKRKEKRSCMNQEGRK